MIKRKVVSNMKKKLLKMCGIILGICIICTGISRGLYVFSLANVTVTSIKEKKLNHDIKKEARIEHDQESTVLTEAGQIIIKINVKEGDMVTEGQTLFEVDINKLQEQVDNLGSEIQVMNLQIQEQDNTEAKQQDETQLNKTHANENYNQIVSTWKETLNKSLEDIKRAKIDYEAYSQEENSETDKLKELEKIVNEQQRTYEIALEQRDKEVLAAKQAIESAGVVKNVSTSAEQIRLQKEQKEKEKEKLSALLENSGTVNAPIAGYISKINILVGEPTTESAALLIAGAAAGQKVAIRISGEEEKHLNKSCKTEIIGRNQNNEEVTVQSATIYSIVKEKSEAGGDSDTSVVTLQIQESVFPISTIVTVKLLNESFGYGACIPMEALHQESMGKYCVFVITTQNTMLGEEKIAHKIPVQILDKDNEYAALAEGDLSQDQIIISVSDKSIQDGSPVRLKGAD